MVCIFWYVLTGKGSCFGVILLQQWLFLGIVATDWSWAISTGKFIGGHYYYCSISLQLVCVCLAVCLCVRACMCVANGWCGYKSKNKLRVTESRRCCEDLQQNQKEKRKPQRTYSPSTEMYCRRIVCQWFACRLQDVVCYHSFCCLCVILLSNDAFKRLGYMVSPLHCVVSNPTFCCLFVALLATDAFSKLGYMVLA